MQKTRMIKYKIICKLSFAMFTILSSSAYSVDYTITAVDNILNTGEVISAVNPIILQKGDTLTVNGANLTFALAANPMIIAYGDNTITVKTGFKIESPDNMPDNTKVIDFRGAGKTKIIIEEGATIAGSTIATTQAQNKDLFNTGNEQVSLELAGTLTGSAYFNLFKSKDNTLALLGTTSIVNNVMNNAVLETSNSSRLFVGGKISINTAGLAQEELVGADYNFTQDYNPFSSIRVFKDSKINISGQTISSADAKTNILQVDQAAEFTFSGSPAAGFNLEINNINNEGKLTVEPNVQRQLLTNNLVNKGDLYVKNLGIIAGNGTTPSFTNNTATKVELVSGSIEQFSTITNAGIINVTGTLKNIAVYNQKINGVLNLLPGSTIDNVSNLNIDAGSFFVINNSTFNNMGTSILNNTGTTSLTWGTATFKTINNQGNLIIENGNLGDPALPGAILVNKADAKIYANNGIVRNFSKIENYGTLYIKGATLQATVVDLYNFNIIEHSSGILQVTNLNTLLNSSYKLTGDAAINTASALNLNGYFLIDTTAGVSDTITNEGTLEIKGATYMQSITNNNQMKMSGNIVFNAGQNLSNNKDAEIGAGAITIDAIDNGAKAKISHTGSVTINLTADYENSGYVYFKAAPEINLNGAGVRFLNKGTSVLQVETPTILTVETYINNGKHVALVDKNLQVGSLKVIGDADLLNCIIEPRIHRGVTGKHSFKIIDSNELLNDPLEYKKVNYFLRKQDISYNDYQVYVDYERPSLLTFNLSTNTKDLASAIEELMLKHDHNRDDLNELITEMEKEATDTVKLEEFLQRRLPAVTTPVQNITVQKNTLSLLSNRKQAIRVAYAAGENYKRNFTPWLKLFRNIAKQKDVNYRFKTNGMSLGADYLDLDGSFIGASFTYGQSFLKSSSLPLIDSRTFVYQANIFGQLLSRNNYYSEGVLGLSFNKTKQNKVISNNIAYANYSWQHFNLKYEFGYNYNYKKVYYIAPFIAAQYTFLKGYSYNEYGAAINSNISSNLYVRNPSAHVLDLIVGFGLSADLEIDTYKIKPMFKYGLLFNPLSDKYKTISSLIDDTILFKTETKTAKYAHMFSLSNSITKNNLSFILSLNSEFYKNFYGHSIVGTIKYEF